MAQQVDAGLGHHGVAVNIDLLQGPQIMLLTTPVRAILSK